MPVEHDQPADPAPSPDLASRQAALVAALVAGAPPPPDFDADDLAATRRALLRKRAGEAARVWPLLAASLGADWQRAFAAQHDGHAPAGALRDGWDVARAHPLTPAGTAELADRERTWHYDGHTAPRLRRRARLRRLLSRRLLRRTWKPHL